MFDDPSVNAPIALVLLSVIALFITLERIWPRVASTRFDGLKWVHGAVLYAVGALLNRLALPVGFFSAAAYAEHNTIGLFHHYDVPFVICAVLTVVLLDLTNFVRHVVLHHVPILWRIHRLHHSDETMDASTGFRFHPLEALLTGALMLGVIFALGAPAEAVLAFSLFEIFLDVWEHSNVKTPRIVERLSGFLVTPGLHRIHHYADETGMTRNYGTMLTIWDRLFGTIMWPTKPEDTARFGLHNQGDLTFDTIGEKLIDPIRNE